MASCLLTPSKDPGERTLTNISILSLKKELNQMVAPNWPGLYKWAARYSDGTDPSSFDRLSEQEKQW